MRSKFVVLAVLAVFFALPSRADSIDYTLTFEGDPFKVVTFSLPVNPLPTNTGSTGFSIQFVSGNFDGFAENFDIGIDGTNLSVLLDDFPNTIRILAFLTDNSMPLFSGDPAHPTLLAGTFTFGHAVNNSSILTAKLVSSTGQVPEPSSLYLLAVGMIALFFKLRG